MALKRRHKLPCLRYLANEICELECNERQSKLQEGFYSYRCNSVSCVSNDCLHIILKTDLICAILVIVGVMVLTECRSYVMIVRH